MENSTGRTVVGFELAIVEYSSYVHKTVIKSADTSFRKSLALSKEEI